ncbi:hypothetical protein LX86_008596 [Lentzea aerocolonigenes]|nr:hypothetical protein [Lentzea aerocolonigenes]
MRDVVRTALRDREAVLHAVADDELAPDLAAAYRESYRWRARREARKRRIDATTERLINFLFYSGLLLLFVLLANRSSSGWLAAVFYVGGWLTGVLALHGLNAFLRRLPLGLQVFVYGVGTAGVVGGLYLLWRAAGPADALLDTIAAEMWRIAVTGFALVPVTLFGLMAPTLGPANWLRRRSALRTQPRLALLTELFALAHALNNPRALDDQSRLLGLLDNAAVVLESHFWKQIQLTNPLSRHTWRSRCRQCAQRLRSFDLWIVLPRRETRTDLQAEIVNLIHVLVRGSLDELPTAPPGPRRLAVLGNAVRGLVLGLIPLAAVFGAKVAGLDLSGPMGGAFVVAAVAWFVLTMLTTFDGQATGRLSLLKDAADAMASFRGGKL